MQIIRSGVDSIYLAIKGTLPAEVLSAIDSTKQQAKKERSPVAIELANGQLLLTVNWHGASGGYAFNWDTGPLGAIWSCRETADRPNWNFFVKPHASALLAHGFPETVRAMLAFIPTLGGQVIEHAINRIDYAIDIRADDFVLELNNFVSHPRAKCAPHWEGATDSTPRVVFAGRRLESAMIGKMPGRQISVYDKTAEARAKRNLYWFEAWRIEPADHNARVWRVELRLGKRELKERRKITTFADLDRALRSALADLLASIRYLEPGQTDPNITRRKPHPIWLLANGHIHSANFLGAVGEVAPGRIIEITVEQKQDIYLKLLTGTAAGLAGMKGLDDAAIEARLSIIAAKAIDAAISTDQFRRTLSRARAKRRAFG